MIHLACSRPEPQSAVDAPGGLSIPVPNLDVLQRVAQNSPSSVTNGHVALHLNNVLLLDEFQGIGAVLALGVLRTNRKRSWVGEQMGGERCARCVLEY